jgi:hypothetical protein
MDAFPDELKGEASLKVFEGKDVSDLAKAYVETKKMVGNRIELPKADDPDSFHRFAAAVRPETADVYQIDLPEGVDSGFADHMRPAFHEAGLLPAQAEQLVAANNAYYAKLEEQAQAAGLAEVGSVKDSMGAMEFEQSRLAVNNWLNRLGIPIEFDMDLARILKPGGSQDMVGAGNSIRLLFDLARRTGEMGKVSDTDMSLALGQMTPEMAQKNANAIVKDPAKAKILTGPDGEEKTALQAQLAAYTKVIQAAG